MYKPPALCSLVIILIVSVRAVPNADGPKNYYISPSKTNFYAARDHCVAHGADLATFESIAELERVSDYLIQNGYNSEYNDKFWVSYWDVGRPEGQFYSIATGQPLTISGWTHGDPNNFGGVEHCVQIWKRQGKFGMNDINCNANFRALCQQRTYFYPQKCFLYGNQNGTCA